RFLNTGRMQKLRWIHVADPGPHSVDVINVVDGHKAAARCLRIYHIRGDLPDAGAGDGRSYGIHTERCFYTSGIGMNFGVGQPQNARAARDADRKRSPIQRVLKDLVWMHRTAERYTQYLKFAGQNCFVMGCYQYSNYNTPYVPAPTVDDSRVLQCLKTMLANTLDANGIDIYAGVEFSQSYDVRTYANNAEVARGADTIWMIERDGRQRYGHRRVTIVPNWLHPAVRRSFQQVLEDLARTFGHLEHFRGVHMQLGPSVGAGYWVPAFGGRDYDDPLAASFDDITIRRFEHDTGIELPVPKTDPDRFKKRAELLQLEPLRSRFLQWRCRMLRDYLAAAVQTLRTARPDLRIVAPVEVEDEAFFKYLVRSGKSFDQILREFAIDVAALNKVPGLTVGRWTISWRAGRPPLPSQNPFCWLARTRPDVIRTFSHARKRFVFVRTSWDENMFATGGYAVKDRNDHDRLVESDWIMNGEKIRALPQPAGYFAREAFAQAIITADPNLLVGGFTDLNINVGHEQALRELLVPFTHLPRERFDPVLDTGLDTNLAIRQLVKRDESFFYVVNPCPWRVRGHVTARTPSRVCDLITGDAVLVRSDKRLACRGVSWKPAVTGDINRLRQTILIDLAPFAMAAFRVDSPQLEITAYRTEPLDPADLARLESIPRRVGQLLANPVARLSLAAADRQFIQQTLDAVRKSIADGQYAAAWCQLTGWRFWWLWQEFLEKDAAARAGRAGLAGRSQAEPGNEVHVTRAERPGNELAERSIRYNERRNVIWVRGFPEERPATLQELLEADRRNGWGKVRYDAATDMYTIDADLWIGDDKCLGTFFQIGDHDHPRVTVVMRGTIWVRPPQESPARSDGLESIINRLTLGDPNDASIRPTLKFDCDTPGQHGLYVGFRGIDSSGKHVFVHRGSLRVYNATITAARQDRQHRWGVRAYTSDPDLRWGMPGWYASDVQVINSTISWFEGCITYGLETGRPPQPASPRQPVPPPQPVIRGTTFEHGGAAVKNGVQYLEDCTFRHMEVAIAEGGALAAKLVRCTFENNRRNWTLGSVGSRGIELIDCRI
ncbi:MAG: hypothetical protein GXP27_21140, partial [Planctomycetes bacterium]|nr:hypothetical protein [Planctomycetota bacterium]